MPRAKADASDWHDRGAASRARIIEVATRLFVRKGYAGTSVSQIAREAGLTIPPIYHHFGNKLGVFEAVIASAGDQIARDVEDLAASDLRSGISALVGRVVANLDAHEAGLRLRLLISFQDDDEAKLLGKLMKARRDESAGVIARYFERLLPASISRPCERAELMAQVFLSGLQHLCLDSMSSTASTTIMNINRCMLSQSLAEIGEREDFSQISC